MPTPTSLVLVLLTSTVALGAVGGAVELRDSSEAYSDNRIVSPTGMYYAVLRSKKGVWRGPFSLHKRREGVGSIEPAIYPGRLGFSAESMRKAAARIGPDPHDAVLFARKLPRLPRGAKVCESPVGVILFDTYPYVGSGAILSFVDAAGKEKWSVGLKALFSKPIKRARSTMSAFMWSNAWGMDAERRTAWVLTKGDEFREVSLLDGKISTPPPAVITRWCKRGEEKVCIAVLDAVVRSKVGADPACVQELAPFVSNVKEPIALRLRAAVACRRAGSKVDYKALFVQAVADASPEVFFYAISHLAKFAEEDAVPILRAFVLRHPQRIQFPRGRWGSRRNYNAASFVDGLRALGPRGLTMLRALLHQEDASGLARLNAAFMLSLVGHEKASPGLLALCRDKEVGVYALDLLIGHNPPDLTTHLIELAQMGSGADIKIVLYFKAHPEKAAVPALLAIQNRSPSLDKAGLRKLRSALVACRWPIAEKGKK